MTAVYITDKPKQGETCLIKSYFVTERMNCNTRISNNIGLVHHVVKRVRPKRCQVSYDDLVQEGIFGLVEAHERYDSKKGAFSTYAYFWVRKNVSNAIYAQSNTIRIPRSKFRNEYLNYASLDELHDQLLDNDERMTLVDDGPDVTKYLRVLNPREKAIVRMKFGFIDDVPMTNQEIGEVYGISGEAIRQTYSKALKKMQRIA